MKTSLAPSVTTRDRKGLKFVSIVEAAYNKAGLSEDEAQRVNDAPGLSKLVDNFITDSRSNNRYADEEVRSNYAYPSEYEGPKPIEKQVDILAGIFELSLGGTMEFMEKVLPTLTLPEWAEGWGAFPSVDAVAARFFPEVKDPKERYCRATNLVLEKISDSRKFYNYRKGEILPDRFRQHARAAYALDLIAEKQKGDILIFPFQFGKRHAGRSTRRAWEAFEQPIEFGLGAFHTGSQILVHPERLVRYEELDMDCPGDEFSPGADGDFSKAPRFYFSGGGVEFGTYWVGGTSDGYGSVSGAVPQ
ncbi:MAG: hypothetical protein V1696_03060 [Candidatus Jorgensenbacteria bacterium]